jgi:hypothetical protein
MISTFFIPMKTLRSYIFSCNWETWERYIHIYFMKTFKGKGPMCIIGPFPLNGSIVGMGYQLWMHSLVYYIKIFIQRSQFDNNSYKILELVSMLKLNMIWKHCLVNFIFFCTKPNIIMEMAATKLRKCISILGWTY